MFADATLSARIDRAEGRLVAQMAAESRAGAGGGPFILPISGGVSVFAGPRSPMNKVIGLGFDTGLDLEALGEIEDRWSEREEPVRIELSTLVDPDIAGALSDRGYRLRHIHLPHLLAAGVVFDDLVLAVERHEHLAVG